MKTNKDFKKLPKKTAKNKPTLKSDKDKIKHLTRLIKLMIILDNGALNLDRAAEECGVSKRTIQRDVEILQAAGILLYKPNEQNSNYHLRPDFQLSKFQVTEKNARDFADALDVLSEGLGKPFPWVLPVQEEVKKAGRAAQKKRKAEWDRVYSNTLDELVTSTFLSMDAMETQPYQTILSAWEACRFFNQEEKNDLYTSWNAVESFRIGARYYWLNRQYKNALFFCDLIIKKAPKDIWAYRQAVLICYALRDHKKAYKYLLDGLEQDRKDLVLHFYWIFLYVLDKKYEDAMKLFNAACKGKFWQTHFAAMMYAYSGKPDKALSAIAQGKKDDPQQAAAYDELKQKMSEIKIKQK